MRSCSGVEGRPTRLRAQTHKLRAQTNETRLVFLQPLVDAYVEYSGCYSSFLSPAVFVLPSHVPSFPPPHISFCHPCRRGLLPTAAPLQSAHLLIGRLPHSFISKPPSARTDLVKAPIVPSPYIFCTIACHSILVHVNHAHFPYTRPLYFSSFLPSYLSTRFTISLNLIQPGARPSHHARIPPCPHTPSLTSSSTRICCRPCPSLGWKSPCRY